MKHILSIALLSLVCFSCSAIESLFAPRHKTENSVATTQVPQSPPQTVASAEQPSTDISAQTTAPTTPTATSDKPTTRSTAEGVAPQQTATSPTAETVTSAETQPVAIISQQTNVTPAPTSVRGDRTIERADRRAAKNALFVARIDSLVNSKEYLFQPTSVQEMPGGNLQLIYNQNYYMGVFPNHIEMHLPTYRVTTIQYVDILNFDTFDVSNYQLSKTQFGWSISFNVVAKDDMNYAVSIMVYTLTGEAVVNLLTLSNTMRYVGTLSAPD